MLIASLRQRAIRIEHAVPPDTESTEKGELLTRTTSTDRLGDLELPRDVSELASSQMGKKGKVVSPPVSVSVPVPVLMGKKGFGYNGVGVGNVQEIRPALTVLGEGGGNVPRRSKR